ncbi:glycoside hydrolase [Panus rudis PR-1116 ss-1]|nr:glycoside hydrolase [Panus rudis PR-1116 ss-1]
MNNHLGPAYMPHQQSVKLSSSIAALVIAACEIAQVSAHSGVLSYSISGQTYNGFTPYNKPTGQTTIEHEWDSHNPITDPNHPSRDSVLWNGSLRFLISPVMVYMANCNGACTTANTASLTWFKIDEAGLISGNYNNGTWAQGELIANNNSWTSTIPASLVPGEYMIRHELLAIHTPTQPQFYPECAQLKITVRNMALVPANIFRSNTIGSNIQGSGTAQPPSSYLVKLPGANQVSDPGVTLNVYSHPTWTNYTVPGPAVWRG